MSAWDKNYHLLFIRVRLVSVHSEGPLWSWSYGSWIYNYLCNQCLSQLTFEPRPDEMYSNYSTIHSVPGVIFFDTLSNAVRTVIPKHPKFRWVSVAHSFIFCVVFCRSLFFFFSDGHCIVGPSSIYGFWLPRCYLFSL